MLEEGLISVDHITAVMILKGTDEGTGIATDVSVVGAALHRLSGGTHVFLLQAVPSSSPSSVHPTISMATASATDLVPNRTSSLNRLLSTYVLTRLMCLVSIQPLASQPPSATLSTAVQQYSSECRC